MENSQNLGPIASSAVLAPVVVEPSGALDAGQFRTSSFQKHDSDSLLMDYFRLISRRRTTICLFALAGILLGLSTTLAVLPVYQARTSLDIQNLNSDFMNMRAVAPTGDNANSESYIQTQIKLLQSDTLRLRTADRIRRDSQVQSFPRQDLLSQIKRTLGLPTAQPINNQELLAYASKHVTIKSLGLTRLVEVTCDSWDPQFSARFCNTLIREFAAQDREVRWNEAQKTSEWLSRQLADVRDSLAQSERKLEGSTGDDALVITQGGGSVAEEKLRELQSELMKAQADRVLKQAQYAISTSASPDSLPVVLDSGSLRETESKLEDLRRQMAALVPPLTPANPKVQHLAAQIRELESSVAAGRGNVLSRIRNEYDAARQRESLLSTAYASQAKKVSQEVSRNAQVNMLRREVDSGQQLYQTLLQRVKEAGFASAMQATTIRVVDAAASPLFPIAPRKGAASIVGLIAGLFAGMGIAFFKERTQTVLRLPGEVPRYLHLRELGVIPSAKSGLGRPYGRIRRQAVLPPVGVTATTRSDSEGALDMAVSSAKASLIAEAYRNTTYSILLAGQHGGRSKTYVISSPNVGDGKTTVTCNLGLALAQANRRVLLIDGDVRKPRLHKALQVENKVGLRNLVSGDLDLETSPIPDFCQATGIPNLFVIPSGTGSEDATGLLHSSRLAILLRRLAGEFDIVLIDSPPMLHLADARILAGKSNGVILVFRSRSTDREAATVARDMFQQDRVRVVGTILNDFDPVREGKDAYYSTYYKYRTESNKQPESSRTA